MIHVTEEIKAANGNPIMDGLSDHGFNFFGACLGVDFVAIDDPEPISFGCLQLAGPSRGYFGGGTDMDLGKFNFGGGN
jgi:hypothetical protein